MSTEYKELFANVLLEEGPLFHDALRINTAFELLYLSLAVAKFTDLEKSIEAIHSSTMNLVSVLGNIDPQKIKDKTREALKLLGDAKE